VAWVTKVPISSAKKNRKRLIGAIGVNSIHVPAPVKISRPDKAGFLLDSQRLTLREIVGATSEINGQIRAEMVPWSRLKVDANRFDSQRRFFSLPEASLCN
jgi:hypothetical protein